MGRPGIMLYFDILEPIRVLPDADKGRLLVAMLEYGKDGIVPEFEGMLALAWGFVQPKLDRDGEAYDNSKVQRQYAAFCKRRNSLNLPKIPFEDWLQMDMDERKRMSTNDNEPLRAVESVASRYPSTTTTTTTTPATPTSTTTKSSASTAAAAETTDETAATADNVLKSFGGKLGKDVVLLTDAQVEDLLARMGIVAFDNYVEKLSNFIIRNDARVASHYDTILKWWRQDSRLET